MSPHFIGNTLQSLKSSILFCSHCHFLCWSPLYLIVSFQCNDNWVLFLICLHVNCHRHCHWKCLCQTKTSCAVSLLGHWLWNSWQSSFCPSIPSNLSSQPPFSSNVWPYTLQITMNFTQNTQYFFLNILYFFPDSISLLKLPIPVFRIYSFSLLSLTDPLRPN